MRHKSLPFTPMPEHRDRVERPTTRRKRMWRPNTALREVDMMFRTKTGLGLAAGLLLGAALPAAAQDQELTLCWAAWDPANALVELSKDFTTASGINDELRVRALAELRRPHAQRAELRRQALRPPDRRQPVDRRLGRERLLRQAERLLRRRRHQHGRLRPGDRLCLFDLAEGHAELLGAAGDGRRQRLVLPQGLVREPRDHGRLQGAV